MSCEPVGETGAAPFRDPLKMGHGLVQCCRQALLGEPPVVNGGIDVSYGAVTPRGPSFLRTIFQLHEERDVIIGLDLRETLIALRGFHPMNQLGHIVGPLQRKHIVVGIDGFAQNEFTVEVRIGTIGGEPQGAAVAAENGVQIVVRIAPQGGVVVSKYLVLVEVGLPVLHAAPHHG